MSQLAIKPKQDWGIWGKAITAYAAIAEANWPAVRVFITHKPAQWNNHPDAHLYLPMLPDLPGVLSALSYQIDLPAAQTDDQSSPGSAPIKHYVRIGYSYYSKSGNKRHLNGRSIAVVNFPLNTGLGDGQQLSRLKGHFTILLPQQTHSSRIPLKGLWQGVSIDGITVTLTEVSRGMFPGYGIKLQGDLDKLVNLHGLSAAGERIIASPINFQEAGYWTLTLPFSEGMRELELITATRQQRYELPFNFSPDYPPASAGN